MFDNSSEYLGERLTRVDIRLANIASILRRFFVVPV